ncbi:MAG TPA: GTP-binding protein [Nitrososphaeraceae archaeon]|nr:GTP-binding protein [Nitrososphaeraceae archaeon]
MGIPEKIKEIEDEIHKTQINKATEFHIGLLKAKIAKLKRELEDNRHGKTVSRGKGSSGYDVRKEGDATIVLIGFPSVGKSTLLNSLTNANSKIASYQFTTLTAIPGMMEYRGAKIQVIDLPGIIKGAASGKGMGKKVLSVARNADLVLIVVDVFQPNHFSILVNELSEIGIKVNKKPPNIHIHKTEKGGIAITLDPNLQISESMIREMCRIYGIHNGRITIRDPNIQVDDLIDVLAGNRVYPPSIIVLNKIDLIEKKALNAIIPFLGKNVVPVSAHSDLNIDLLKDSIFNRLEFIRIYMRPKGQETDYKEPLIVRKDTKVKDICAKLHRTMLRDFRFALVWGNSVKFEGQKVGLDHVLSDQDVLTIIKKVNAL